MALFRIGPASESATFVRGDGLYLRPAEMRDYPAWSALRERSRVFLMPWEPTWPADDLTRASFRRRIRRHAEEIEQDEAYSLLLFREADDLLLGGLTIGQIRRGVAQAATLGYWMGAPHAGRGHMSKAVRAATGFAFATLRLHRLEAACLPTNEASVRLLEGAGFHREGFARAYLRINGAWQDHVLYGLLESDPLPLRLRKPGGE
ncbi:MAG: GNAT family protein [Beijerinckiaceae bacterium]